MNNHFVLICFVCGTSFLGVIIFTVFKESKSPSQTEQITCPHTTNPAADSCKMVRDCDFINGRNALAVYYMKIMINKLLSFTE